MRVSILVPLYGVERYVERCARSLFEQSFDEIEFIFVDDCSPDRSADVVERVLAEYPERQAATQIIRNSENVGVSASRNRALESATGRFVIFVDGDDWVAPEMVEELVLRQIEYSSDIVMSNYFEVDGEAVQLVNSAPIGGRRGSLRIVASQSFALPNRVWGLLMCREVIERNNVRFDERVTMGEDFIFLVKVLYFSKSISFINKGLYYYRLGVGVMSSIGVVKQRSYIRAVFAVRSFLGSRVDCADFRGALWLSRVNLRRWVFMRRSCGGFVFRGWCYSLNFFYRLYCSVRG